MYIQYTYIQVYIHIHTGIYVYILYAQTPTYMHYTHYTHIFINTQYTNIHTAHTDIHIHTHIHTIQPWTGAEASEALFKAKVTGPDAGSQRPGADGGRYVEVGSRTVKNDLEPGGQVRASRINRLVIWVSLCWLRPQDVETGLRGSCC